MNVNFRTHFFFLLVLFLPFFATSQIVINEYSAANLHNFTDNFESTEDWIELYNASNFDLDIGGWYLSDKVEEPTKWMIPDGTR